MPTPARRSETRLTETLHFHKHGHKRHLLGILWWGEKMPGIEWSAEQAAQLVEQLSPEDVNVLFSWAGWQ
jgi:hypothetical protein